MKLLACPLIGITDGKATCKVMVLAPSKNELSKDRTQIEDIDPGEEISVKGIIQSTHNIKSITIVFLSVDDDTGAQIVTPK